VVAEEAVAAGRVPVIAQRFFLVDPLDGTREFVSHRDEFTVNIALIESAQPVLGVVYAPARHELYWGDVKAAQGRVPRQRSRRHHAVEGRCHQCPARAGRGADCGRFALARHAGNRRFPREATR
jgi:3'-phosphoadenosine 5'-phosphosulfate (PAPS) 3'-phosphatase